MTKPVIKFVGGKTQLLEEIKKRLPDKYNHYYEPFLGGGAVLLSLAPKIATVSDVNKDLINMYEQIKEHPDSVIWSLERLDNLHTTATDAKKFYYDVRTNYNTNMVPPTAYSAAQLIYLNKHCFNGLYRVNKKGEFNVPFNGKLTGKSYDENHIREVSEQIQDVTFLNQDFELTLEKCKPGDFVFLDPPYVPLNPTSFIDYTKEGFSYEDHLRVARIYKELSDKGVYCMLTNHDTELVRELYKDYKIETVDVRRSINRDGNNRKGKEVIITNY